MDDTPIIHADDGRTDCSEVADWPFPDGEFTYRDIGESRRSQNDMKIAAVLQAGKIFGRSYKEDFAFLPGLHYQEALSHLESLPEVAVHDTNTLHQGWWIRFAFSNCEYLLVTPSPEVSRIFADSMNTTKTNITSQLMASLTLITTYFSDESHADKIDHHRLNQLTSQFLLSLRLTNR